MKVYISLIVSIFLVGISCSSEEKQSEVIPKEEPLFTLLSPEETNIHFNNTLPEGTGINRNVLMYEYFYNGAGVAVGDLNNDGLEDLYFTGNMSYNKLYLNKGDMKFQDITRAAAVGGRKNTWKSGVTMADVNGDGLLDIYVCYTGQLPLNRRIDELYINQGVSENGIPVFKEQAKAYGLAQPHSSNKASFFDYDRDNDLDLFLLNHNVKPLPILDKEDTRRQLAKQDPVNGVRLYRNDEGRFTDVTEKAGIQSSLLMYGLGTGIADINKDGWPDIYIANDYSPPDYLYINNQDGTFTDKLGQYVQHTSFASMGIDIADINNDALLDIYVLDMLPADNRRQKILNSPNDWGEFEKNIEVGFHHQYTRNVLQLNNGNNTFSEISHLSGVAKTDWSWAPLIADYDNDGHKDLFVTNGNVRDVTNRDYIQYERQYIQQQNSNLQSSDVAHLLQQLPGTKLKNYIFQNNGDLTFKNTSSKWGIDLPSNSQGAAYADLDNDGDLDLVTSNINDPAFVFENETIAQTNHHYLKVALEGKGQNTYGIGSKVTIYTKDEKQYLEQMPMRGYLSSVSPILHFGLGSYSTVDSLHITWPNGQEQTLTAISADQQITLRQQEASPTQENNPASPPLFEEFSSPISYSHQQEQNTNDFKRQPLMVNAQSTVGPAMAKADLNADGFEDIFVGGGYGQPAKIYLQQTDGSFTQKPQPAFQAAQNSTDARALFFDANDDGHPDLYVASGGYGSYAPVDPALQDRLYLNDGQGNFADASDGLPDMPTSSSAVTTTDINNDGALDLFVGGYVIPGKYPESPRSYMLINNGNGQFMDQTSQIAPLLRNIGMVRDALWHDLNGDEAKELVVAGHWMPLRIFEIVDGQLADATDTYFDRLYRGLWNNILIEDFNNDGKPDLLAGNLGTNSRLNANTQEPAELYYHDFDENGSINPILFYHIQGTSHPFPTLPELTQQLPMMESRFSSHEEYGRATLEDVFTGSELEDAKKLQTTHLPTSLFLSNDDGKWVKKELPIQAQFSPIFVSHSLDYNNDGQKDLFLGGNQNHSPIRLGKYDANYGILLKGDGKGDFNYVPQHQSGFNLVGDLRNILMLDHTLLFGINGQPLKAYQKVGDH
ncbi:VCBS repeat-containing protein [Fodinibius salsisoli]|uniref:VCBS repeat-containing protein n=1 Tax=Fodinibius salsisoli TaxID=2820877 RepID=A0ABT3PLC4_9BACT|nr:VCBS repeat-containing protein [Fodinibius salsisoli]MCW9706709.1 VCBS repeat-containing protein [Fodinibius salsisoli]